MEPAWHWPDVIWQAHLAEGSIRENRHFHGEYLCVNWAPHHSLLSSFFLLV